MRAEHGNRETASARIVTDKSALVSNAHVGRIIDEASRSMDHRVVHASFGYNMVLNNFALITKETKHASLLMALPSQIVSHDGYEQAGYEMPVLNETAFAMQKPDLVWRARRRFLDGNESYWDGSRLYSPWTGVLHISIVLIDHLRHSEMNSSLRKLQFGNCKF